MNKVWVFLLFLLAPVIVLIVVSKSYADNSQLGMYEHYDEVITYETIDPIDTEIDEVSADLRALSIRMTDIETVVDHFESVFAEFTSKINQTIQSSKDQKYLSDDIYEQRITKALGEPIDFYLSDTSEIKIFELAELGYRGYIAKIKLFDSDVFKLSLAQGENGKLETTSDAGQRTGAILAINGGGFGAGKVNGQIVSTMIGGAVVDGKVIQEFVPKSNEDLFFVGINRQGDLVGGVPKSHEEVLAMKPYQGVSFIPILIQKGEKIELPSTWANTKHPRTIIGQYANDDLIVIVVDGRQGDYSAGITLERLQDKLLELGVKDAYNLDGGGSTAMYFKGQILNKPSDGHERPVANNFIVLP
ncbi:phosphodiester glycosidase family protein [Acidaminobacter sp. JC074]|uniref:phosphodiester glycosidase family protein n=1 Tax=Acidaminobacter sp. JC074 TaxID=2530199 RepID=UPI001F111F81|nr:phosphodiester glycosidase family protein [Acidaminobacter sp. JC074]MCH4887292.1 phosphodiester glycosidase family protein [Acidaminobacter sp. JC074]